MAEMLAAWKVVVLGVIYLELEGDVMKVVQGINCANHYLGREGLVLNDMKTLFQNFNTWKVTHVNRVANGAAHNLVRLALSVGGIIFGLKIFLCLCRKL
jgi:hypothetical protein